MPVSGLLLRTKADMYHKLKQGLVAYWPLADASAVDLEDYRGYNDLTNVNSVTRADGPSANLPDAAAFVAASSQYFSNSSTRFMQPGRTLTILAWVWPNGVEAGVQEFVGEFGNAGNRSWLMRRSGTAPQLLVSTDGSSLVSANAASADPAGTFSTQTWYLMIGEITPNNEITCQLYGVSGVERTAFASDGVESTNGLLIGASTGTPTNFFNGRMSPVVIRDGLMSEAEKSWYYNDGDGRDLLRGV